MTDPNGKRAGATFLRNNLDKRSIGIDLKQPAGPRPRAGSGAALRRRRRELQGRRAAASWASATRTCARRTRRSIYLSVSGFGNLIESPYDSLGRLRGRGGGDVGDLRAQPSRTTRSPVVGPAGALGDISSALFAVIGVLAALRHRDRTGEGQYVDISMFDSMVAMTDVVTNLWSMGERKGTGRAPHQRPVPRADGWFVAQVGREHQFDRLAELVGGARVARATRGSRPGPDGASTSTTVIRPAVEAWAADKTKLEAAHAMNAEGIAAGPVNSAEDVIADPHLEAREHDRRGAPLRRRLDPYLLPGNPVKLSKVAEGPETRVPWVGEHTDEILRSELGLPADEIGAAARRRRII